MTEDEKASLRDSLAAMLRKHVKSREFKDPERTEQERRRAAYHVASDIVAALVKADWELARFALPSPVVTPASFRNLELENAWRAAASACATLHRRLAGKAPPEELRPCAAEAAAALQRYIDHYEAHLAASGPSAFYG